MESATAAPVDEAVARGPDRKTPTPIIRDAHALLMRGIDALERERIEEAVGLLRQAAELDERAFLAHLALGIALTKALEIPEAQRALETSIRLEPENFYAHLRMAELYQRVGVPTKVQEELRVALDLARTTAEKKMARDLLALDKLREPRRAWRPDFVKLWRERKGQK